MTKVIRWTRNILIAAVSLLLLGVAGLLVTRAVLQSRIEAQRQLSGPRSVDSIEAIKLGGITQYIHIRGADRLNPIILYLHGGPGAPMMPFAWTFQPQWEKDFTVVQWDQRGTGKTFLANDPAQVNPTIDFNRMKADTVELSRYLIKRFGKRRIILLGHSWGTTLGIPVSIENPELFHAFVGTGVVINIPENERVGYAYTLGEAKRRGDVAGIAALKAIAPYPDPVTGTEGPKQMVLREHQVRYGLARTRSRSIPEDQRLMLWAAFQSPDYHLADLRYFLTAEWEADTYARVRAYFIRHDARRWGSKWPIPLVFVVGRQDWQTPSVLADRYLRSVDTPFKQTVWIEGAAHAAPSEQPAAFADALRRVVRPLAVEGEALARP
jgi:proline iminopeptidase